MDKPQGIMDLDFRIRRAVLLLLYLVIFCSIATMLWLSKPAIEFALTVLSPFIVALIVAYIFNPIVSWLQQKFGLGRIGGVVITYCLILCITVAFFAVLLPILYKQIHDSITNLVLHFPEIMEKTTSWLKTRMHISQQEMQKAKEYLQNNFDVKMITGQAADVTQSAFDTTRIVTGAIGTTLSVIIGFFAFASFVVVICFYFLLDYSRFEHIARVLLPDDKESRVFMIWRKIDYALGGFLRGQLIVACTIGVLYTIGLMLMGMSKYAILVGFLAGFGNLIPYLGPVLGGVPAGLWVLFGDTYDGSQEKLIGIGIIILFSVAIQSLDGFFLQPRIVGKSAELHPLLVLLALLVGAQFGLGGMIIAVPAAIMVRVVVKELWWDPLERIEYESKRQAALENSCTFPKGATVAVTNAVETPTDGTTSTTTTVESTLPNATTSNKVDVTHTEGPSVPRRRRRRKK